VKKDGNNLHGKERRMTPNPKGEPPAETQPEMSTLTETPRHHVPVLMMILLQARMKDVILKTLHAEAHRVPTTMMMDRCLFWLDILNSAALLPVYASTSNNAVM
jgi:hypothetical protein